MDTSTGLISVGLPCNDLLSRLRRSLERQGLRALETFDLQMARSSGAACICPRHGTAECDCQMVVLMVYGEGTAPTALMLHGSDGHTWISFGDSRARGAESAMEAALASSLCDDGDREGL